MATMTTTTTTTTTIAELSQKLDSIESQMLQVSNPVIEEQLRVHKGSINLFGRCVVEGCPCERMPKVDGE